jgi:N-acetylglucosaminyldiphosphoundecaprenol N-acetyl-beta-D-mannosaminyltransferase
MHKLDIHGSQISIGAESSFLETIFESTETDSSAYVCFANVHMIIEAYYNETFRKLLNKALIVAPDGRPLSIFIQLFYQKKQPRVCGMDFMPVVMREAEKRNKSIYFYGGTEEVLQTITRKIKIDFPQLTLAGTHSPPFRPLTEEEENKAIESINNSKADFVFVSLGCPKQELWMAEHKSKLNACMLGVGQAFLVYANMEKRLPKWTHKFALEWVYRLYQEPGRLWKRYLITNSMFVFLTTKFAVLKLVKKISIKLKVAG